MKRNNFSVFSTEFSKGIGVVLFREEFTTTSKLFLLHLLTDQRGLLAEGP